jgi:maltooligosyltrehalose trehalohydrolase
LFETKRSEPLPKSKPARRWKLDFGAEIVPGGVRFRVWAPRCRRVSVVIEKLGKDLPLEAEPQGYFSGIVPHAGAGTLYRYRLDGLGPFPDPASRFQPEGPHGPSQVVDPGAYRWKDAGWRGFPMKGQVIYEVHVGAFTPEGTLDAASAELAELRDAGVTLIELMPLAEFPGRFNWGYDGVDLFAPCSAYGDPEALKRFVDRAHALGLGVVLDVVYNHLGPDGNYLAQYSPDYFTDRYKNEWGQPINFDGPGSREVREFFIGNACYWIREFHLDGLRLDATQSIYDSGPVHVLSELTRRVRETAWPRRVLMIGENEPQDARCLAPAENGGFGLDAVWSDDFHHAARVALTGKRDAYFMDYRGQPQELISAVKRGHLYQGQRYLWQKKPRGTPVTVEPAASFVFFLQNHDQIANHLWGERLCRLSGADRCRAMTALLLLAPQTPLLFMGQEFGSSRPFHFFADHQENLAPLIHKGRREFLAQFAAYASADSQKRIPDPRAPATFAHSKLDFSERKTNAPVYRLHKDLLRLRREDPVIAAQDRSRLDGAVLSSDAFVLRFFGPAGSDRLLAVNLGPDLAYQPAPEPLLAPPAGTNWKRVWSSEDTRYGGSGIVDAEGPDGWKLQANSAVLLAAHVLKSARRNGS